MLAAYDVLESDLSSLNDHEKLLVTTLNAHSYNVSRRDNGFARALKNSHVLLPDGVAVVLGKKCLQKKSLKKIAGHDFFNYSMHRLQKRGGGKVFFLGSTDSTLEKIKNRANVEFPAIEVHTYSPPYKDSFSESDTLNMLDAVNQVQPDVLFIGMTAPKQEKWAYENFQRIKAGHIGCIGAVFDFYAGTVKRAPQWMIHLGMEWFCRLIKEPRRMFRRYVIGNSKFLYYLLAEALTSKTAKTNVEVTDIAERKKTIIRMRKNVYGPFTSTNMS